MKLDFELEIIKYSSDHTIRINELSKLLQYYFNNGRPKNFIKYVDELIDIIPEMMNNMSFNELLYIIPNYYQFCYTVTIEDNFSVNQNKISKKLLVPFSKSLINILHKLNFGPLSYEVFENRYVIICRHAITKGMYAPGAVIYSITSGLLKLGKQVIVVSLGNIDQNFLDLKKNNSNLSILKKDDNSTAKIQLINLRKICENFRPVKIITEMPINIGTALYYSNVTSKILYWSPGFTQVPWFDKVMLVPELVNEELLKSKKFTEIPRSINFELLSPNINLKLVESFKKNNFIENTDFVIGTFSRYDKISKLFLELVFNLLEVNKNRKIIIAGTNDSSMAKKILKKFILNKQAIILGFSDVHILGHTCNIFLDTIPYPCGSSAIEIMAKGKPVLVLNQTNLDNYKKSRIDELILENETKLNECLVKLETNLKFYNEMSRKSIDLAKSYDKSSNLADVIVSL